MNNTEYRTNMSTNEEQFQQNLADQHAVYGVRVDVLRPVEALRIITT